jgi:drug/metabolite transporter (DMT)-like permease
MFYLLLTIITSVLIIISFKVFQNLNLNTLQIITFSYLFSFCYGLLFYKKEFKFLALTENQWFWPAIFIGAIFILGFILFSQSTKKAGVSITAVSSKMSVIIPVISGFVLFGDIILPIKIIGIIIAISSFYFIFKTKDKSKKDISYIFLPLLLFLVSGINDLAVKFVEHHFLNGDTFIFLSVVFLSAFVIGLLLLLLSGDKNSKKIVISSIIGGFVLGSFNFWNAWAFVRSMTIYESSTLFPIVNVSVVSIAAVSGVVIFKEKISLTNWAGILMAVISILLISMANAN